jgi:predicted dithiol-disulfide oxidoreductase (DUF899 family)
LEQTRLSEPADYAASRQQLLRAEIALMRQREEVAALRRALPPGTAVRDYEFVEGPRLLAEGDEPLRMVRLSELFSEPGRPLVVYHLMYGKLQTTPCPMCTMWIDGLNGVARHMAQNVDFVVAAAADPAALRAHARARGWESVRLLSCGDSTFQYDFEAEDDEGSQNSTLSVFTLDPDGSPRHFYTCHPQFDDDLRERGIDLFAPVWHILDVTPRGRGDWYSGLDY